MSVFVERTPLQIPDNILHENSGTLRAYPGSGTPEGQEFSNHHIRHAQDVNAHCQSHPCHHKSDQF